MSDVAVGPAATDDVRSILARRQVDEATFRAALEIADAGGAWCARDGGETIGMAVAADSDDERCVGDLFVERSYRGRGIGTQLLDAALADVDERTPSVAVDFADPASLALALRRGLAPRAPMLRMTGAMPREEALAKMAAGEYRFEVDAIDSQRHAGALCALDREARATTRLAWHERNAARAAGQLFYLAGECVAYAYVWPDGRVGPLAAVSGAYLVQLFAFALVTLQRTYGASWCSVLVPAGNVRIGRAALRAGLEIDAVYARATHPAAAADALVLYDLRIAP